MEESNVVQSENVTSVKEVTTKRRKRVLETALALMETKGGFPSARAIYDVFLDKQWPGNPNAISNDLKSLTKDIAQVYLSKEKTEIEGEVYDIPPEALNYAVQAYNSIKVEAVKETKKIEDKIKNEMKILSDELDSFKTQLASVKSDLSSKKEFLNKANQDIAELKLRNETLEQFKSKYAEENVVLNRNVARLNEIAVHADNEKQEHKENIVAIKQAHEKDLKLQDERNLEQSQQLITKYDGEIELKDNEIQRLSDANEAQIKLTDEQIKLKDASNDANKELELKLKNEKTQLGIVELENVNLNSDKNSLEIEIEELKEEAIKLKGDKDKAEEINGIILQEREAQDSKVDELKTELINMTLQLKSIEGEIALHPSLQVKKEK